MAVTSNIFEYATRNKLRFQYKGSITVEDLWDLKLTDLDSIYKDLNAKVKTTKEESLLTTTETTEEDTRLKVSIDIIKYIVSVKLSEKKAAEEEATKKAKKQEILAIMAERQKAALHNASDEELQKMLEDLDN